MAGQFVTSAETVALFCRLNINTKTTLPIRSSEMGLLILLTQSKNPVTPAMAAEFFKVKKPMITAMVTRLSRAGYVVKTPSPDDRRSVILSVTSKAKALVAATEVDYLKTMTLLQEGLGSEKFTALMRLLGQANQLILEDRNDG
ncbi:MarR family winged helix-turn-helix transcriptional regulator [Secundilactobacillus kimchicus]|uniref:MarR family winged helix-turn-helix transcriptional regulator n=1 Tax=Secundilactobacillus kimchicus TaxID=528209 RepID=UPI0024A9C308|nr:MarR family transcriptional regulator [Secundilactobacillus kimchicus]